MSAKSNLALLEAVGKFDDEIIGARRPSALTLSQELLQCQIDAVYELVGRGMPFRDALALVIAACEQAEEEVSS